MPNFDVHSPIFRSLKWPVSCAMAAAFSFVAVGTHAQSETDTDTVRAVGDNSPGDPRSVEEDAADPSQRAEPKPLRPFLRASIGLGYAMTWGFYDAPVDYESNFRGAVPDFALSLGVILDEKASIHAFASEKIASLAGDNIDDVEGLNTGLLGSYFELTTVGVGAAYYSKGSSFAFSGKIGAVRRRVGQINNDASYTLSSDERRYYTSRRWGVEFEFEPAASILVTERVAIGAGVGLGGHIIPSSGDQLIYGWHMSPRFIFEWR